MQIVVCVKQVPETTHVKFDAQDNLLLESAENILNPCCSYAVETAVRLKESHEGATITVFSLGGPQAKDALKRAIAMGCDTGYLLSDPAFTGGDSWAISKVLTAAIKKFIPAPDVLLFGQYSDDAMSGMTGLMVAEQFGVPSITLGSKIEFKSSTLLGVECQTEQGLAIYELQLPGAVCMANCEVEPRIPSIKGVMKANRSEIPMLGLADLGLPVSEVGALGSLTQVVQTLRKPKKLAGTKIDGADPQEAVSSLVAYLQDQKVL